MSSRSFPPKFARNYSRWKLRGLAERESLFAEALRPEQKKLYELLSTDQTLHVDEIVETVRHDFFGGLAALCEMELKGIIRQMPGKQFVRVMM